MSFQVAYCEEATIEFRDAVAWYEEQCEGLGVRFLLEADKLLAAVAFQPLRFSKASRNSRRAQVHGWPYTIYFAINEAHREVKVIAVWHGARNPSDLRRRL